VIKSRKISWDGNVILIGNGSGAYQVLVGKPEEKRPLGTYRCKWEYNIKMCL